MVHRTLLLAGIAASLLASCSQTADIQSELFVADAQHKITGSKPVEVNASLNADNTITSRPIDIQAELGSLASSNPRQQLEFTIGDDVSHSESIRTASAHAPAPSYTQRPVPARGTSQQEVLATLGTPPNILPGSANSEVWDYGTYRVFFNNDKVAFTRVW